MPRPTDSVPHHSVRFLLLAGLAALAALPHAAAQDKQKDKKDAKPVPVLKGAAAEELVGLKREVDALETLYHLEPTRHQLKGLLALAQKTAAKPPAAATASATPEYRQALLDLRNALAKDDEERVAALYQKLAEIGEVAPAAIPEAFEITEAAMKAAPEAVKLFTAAQVVSYLAAQENEVPDPVERVLTTIADGADLKGDDWKALRDETAEEVGWLVHGFNENAARGTVKAVSDLLDRGHRLKPDELKKEMDAIEQAARKAVGGVGPTAVLQHYMERELAELLSNPRAVAALKARLEPPGKK